MLLELPELCFDGCLVCLGEEEKEELEYWAYSKKTEDREDKDVKFVIILAPFNMNLGPCHGGRGAQPGQLQDGLSGKGRWDGSRCGMVGLSIACLSLFGTLPSVAVLV